MTAIALLLAFALPVATDAVPAYADTTGGPPEPGRLVISRDEIEAAGLYRLTDLLDLIPQARAATVDGFTWRVHLGGAPFGEEAWVLLLDGERVELDLFGQQNLALLPVAITQVDSVEVWAGPRLVAGRFAAGGVLHVHTRRPERGPSLRAGVAIGNEVGDPGPFRYVPELVTPNVDKFGADYEGEAGYGGRGWRGAARFKLLRFYATDPVAALRNREALAGRVPALRLLAPAVRLEADALGGTHALSLLGGGSTDLWFADAVGRELPVRRLWGQAALSGRVPVSPRLGLAYRLGVAESRLDEWGETALGLDPDWRGRTMRAGVEGAWHPRGSWAASLGAEAERVTVREAEGFTLGRITAGLARTPSSRQQQRLDAALAAADGDVAASAALSSRHALGRFTLGATAALAQRLPAEARRLSFWRARGYDAFGGLVAFEQDGPAGVTTQAVGRVDAAARLAPALTASAHAGVRAFRGLTLETQPDPPDPAALDAERLVVVEPDAAGEVAGVGVSVRAARGAWTARAFYDGQAPLGGDAAFEQAWAAVPRHRAGASAAVTAGGTFTLWGSLAYRSAARWPAYAGLDGGYGGLYDSAVPAAWLLDAAVEKALWARRLRLSLLFRNLLNHEERYHPVGAALDLRFYLRVELLLGR